MKTHQLKELDSSFKILTGNPSQELRGISHVDDPKPDTFCFVKNKRFLEEIGSLSQETNFPRTGLVLESVFAEKIKDDLSELAKRFLWIGSVQNVAEAMCLFSKPFYDEKFSKLNYFVDGRQMGECDISSHADIAQNVFIGTNCKIKAGVQIHPGVMIMPEVEIEEGTIIYPNVVVYPYTKIGKNCRIHASSVIGADGFGYHFFSNAHQKIWHFSGVEIGDEVEIGASSTIDAGAFTSTKIGTGTKIDNGVQVGHNCQIGKYVIMCGQVGISGSVRLDDYVVLGGNAGVAPGAHLGQGSMVAARAVVGENSKWEAGSKLGGHPAGPLSDWLKQMAALRRLIKK